MYKGQAYVQEEEVVVWHILVAITENVEEARESHEANEGHESDEGEATVEKEWYAR